MLVEVTCMFKISTKFVLTPLQRSLKEIDVGKNGGWFWVSNAVVLCKAYAWATAESDLSSIVVKTMWVKQMDVLVQQMDDVLSSHFILSVHVFMGSWWETGFEQRKHQAFTALWSCWRVGVAILPMISPGSIMRTINCQNAIDHKVFVGTSLMVLMVQSLCWDIIDGPYGWDIRSA